ncbi:uncharacterized protein [Watersipora subatra]|uniref:uncharacterized protein n=1 Tax=Watersipora subatra TaxID=2589382 RepID=UPI00355B9B1B
MYFIEHKPFPSIFSLEKTVSTLTAQQLQQWALTPIRFQYEIKYKPPSKHGNANGLAKLLRGLDSQLDAIDHFDNQKVSRIIHEDMDFYSLDSVEIWQSTLADETLLTVTKWLQHCCLPYKADIPELLVFWLYTNSLFVHYGSMPQEINYIVPILAVLATTALKE